MSRKVSANFKESEFACPHCGVIRASTLLVGVLQRIRDEANAIRREGEDERKVIITSAYRCPEHNKAVGGVVDSKHLYGVAADFYIPGYTSQQLIDFVKKLYIEGKIYVGYAYKIKNSERAIHLDVRVPESLTVQGWAK